VQDARLHLACKRGSKLKYRHHSTNPKLSKHGCHNLKMLQDTSIDITGLDKPELLCSLWQGTKTIGLGHWEGRDDIPPAQYEAFEHLNKTRGRVDYFCGRPIKVDLTPNANEIDAHLYDRDAGQGACRRAVERVRLASRVSEPTQPVPPPTSPVEAAAGNTTNTQQRQPDVKQSAAG